MPGLSVLSRNTSFGLKNKEVDVVEVARRLRATHVIEGGVRIAADRVRITAQLVEGRTGIHLWAERFDSRLDDIFALQSEIASKVAGALSSRLGVTKEKILANKGTKDIEAYQYYLKARSLHFMAWGNIEQLKLARHLYELAARADPGYARAYAGLADCDAYSWVQGDLDLSFDQLLANSSKALELAPNMAEAHGSRGLALHLTGKDEEACEAFERAIALNPELFEPCFFYATCLRNMGRLEEAVRLFERAECLSPTDPMSAAMSVDIFKALGRVEESLAKAKRALALIQTALVNCPDDGHLLALGAGMLVELDRFAEAEEWAGRALAVDSENYVDAAEACEYCEAHGQAILVCGLAARSTVRFTEGADGRRADPRSPTTKDLPASRPPALSRQLPDKAISPQQSPQSPSFGRYEDNSSAQCIVLLITLFSRCPQR